MNQTALTTHLNNLGSIPLLSLPEEQALTQTIHYGQELQKRLDSNDLPADKLDMAQMFIEQAEAARQELVKANLRLVVNIAKKFHGQTHDHNDLIQEGTLGLIRATELFDPTSGNKFSTYATPWIKQRIRLALQETDRPIRHTAHLTTRIRQINKARNDLTLQNHAEPTMEELAIHLGPKWTPQMVEDTLEYSSMHTTSLDAPITTDDGALSLHDIMADDAAPTSLDQAESNDRDAKLYEALTQLNEAEIMLLKLHYGLGSGPEFDIRDAGITIGVLIPNQVKSMHRKILKKLRISSKHLRELTQD